MSFQKISIKYPTLIEPITLVNRKIFITYPSSIVSYPTIVVNKRLKSLKNFVTEESVIPIEKFHFPKLKKY
jgi:hypothetical protein